MKKGQKKQTKENRHSMSMGKRLKKNWQLYIFLLPALAGLILFSYVPMYGIQLAFRDYNPLRGIMGSPWVGFENFTRFFHSPQFQNLLINTLAISFYSLIVGFPIPIILALGLNYVANLRFKKAVQSITYAPYFISTVVLVGILNIFLSTDGGLINQLVKFFGRDPILFMGQSRFWRHIYVWSGVWQSMGWNAVIYIATLAGVSAEMHEAATIDGATKFQRVFWIDLPMILPTIVITLILSCGSIMGIGFEKAYLMQNPLNLGVSEIISTYIYKIGLVNSEYGFSTAVGLFNSVVNCIVLLTVNQAAKRISKTSLW
ncbi:ABC transporter permease subunit [Lacrimispora sp. BS-2]|uniref:ABC transporter permease subunit n=1 Tax=Lacrimispora sp. BS-2 TaxID=3151850 RepID=A0AAU7PVI6_9FIRM